MADSTCRTLNVADHAVLTACLVVDATASTVDRGSGAGLLVLTARRWLPWWAERGGGGVM